MQASKGRAAPNPCPIKTDQSYSVIDRNGSFDCRGPQLDRQLSISLSLSFQGLAGQPRYILTRTGVVDSYHYLILGCIRFTPIHGVGLSFAYVQPSPHRVVRCPFPGPTRGAPPPSDDFPPIHILWSRFFPYIAAYICNTSCIYEIIDFHGITLPLIAMSHKDHVKQHSTPEAEFLVGAY
jgi:hypothetical protein